MSRTRILIVHPDPSTRGLLGSMLQTLGHPIEEVATDRAAVRLLEQAPAGLVLLGTDPADADALELLAYVRRKHPRTPIILLFSTAHPERQREAMQWGAASVLRFPLPATSLRAAVAQALEECEPIRSSTAASPSNGNGHAHGFELEQGISQGSGSGPLPTPTVAPTGSLGIAPIAPAPAALTRLGFGPDIAVPGAAAGALAGCWSGVVGDDVNLRQALELAASIAPTCAPVLIVGEPGTGKSLLARTLHGRSPLRHGPCIELGCAGLSETQLEAELFGRRGVPGAQGDRLGKLAEAQGGTLVLDEVAALTPALQYRLLRAVQDGEYEPVGSNLACRVEARFVVTTREDLPTLVERGQFRQDLYYRLSVVTLNLPPLRHRGEDIERLADYFRTRSARTLGKEVVAFSPEALAQLRRHHWPGNVQELAQVVQRAVVHCRGPLIEPNHLDLHRRESAPHRGSPGSARSRITPHIQPLKEALEGPERQLILQALEALNWNRQETARVLDINRTTLYKKMKKYGLLFDEPAWVN